MKSLVTLTALVLSMAFAFGQTAESLKARIQEHYKTIHSGDFDAVWSDHLEDFSMYMYDGSALNESGITTTAKNMGTKMTLPSPNVVMKHFNAQLYGNVGVATFYLDGAYADDAGLYRVSAVWVWKDGVWREAHHHESKLIN